VPGRDRRGGRGLHPRIFKGKLRDLSRASDKRGGKAAWRGLSAEQIPVIVARDRTGAAIDAVLPRLDAASITAAPVLLSHVFRRFAAPLDLVTYRFDWAANGGQDGVLDAIE
jgi:hypothetical protein